MSGNPMLRTIVLLIIIGGLYFGLLSANAIALCATMCETMIIDHLV